MIFVLLLIAPIGYTLTTATSNIKFKTEVAASAATTGTPAVEISETIFDFGELKDGNDYVHAFAIMNSGTEVLEIYKALPG
jgi:hypothetical protein